MKSWRYRRYCLRPFRQLSRESLLGLTPWKRPKKLLTMLKNRQQRRDPRPTYPVALQHCRQRVWPSQRSFLTIQCQESTRSQTKSVESYQVTKEIKL